MPFSMSGASLSVFETGLNALSALLDKAEAFAAAKKIDPTVLLRTRLAPDMFDFTRQVQIMTDQARRGSARLAGAGQTTFAAKAIAYGLPGLRVDGNDYLAVCAATEWAAARARANHGPTVIELFTYRAAGHSTSDDPTKYRPADEPNHWPLGDPIDRLKQHLIVIGEWSEAQHETLTAELNAAVRSAVKEAEAVGTLGQSKPGVSEMFEDVFKEPDWRVIEQRRELGI